MTEDKRGDDDVPASLIAMEAYAGPVRGSRDEGWGAAVSRRARLPSLELPAKGDDVPAAGRRVMRR